MNSATGYGPSGAKSRFANLCFDGKSDTYQLWEPKFLAYLLTQNESAYSAVTSSQPPSDEEAAANRRAYAEMVQLLDDKSLQLLMHDARDDGNKALKILRSQYASTEKPRILTLYTELTTLKMNENEGVMEYLIRAENSATGLKTAGETISDNLVIAMILKGLPRSYDTFVVVQTQTEVIKTLAELKARLINFANTEAARGDNDAVLRTDVRSRETGEATKDNRQCYACGQTGHISRYCTRKGNLTCSYCGLKGHAEVVCMKKKRGGASASATKADSPEEKKSFVFSAVFKSSVDPNQSRGEPGTLVVDCAATKHIINDPSMFTNLDPLFQTTQYAVELADGHRSTTLITGKGTATVNIVDAKGESHSVTLQNALCAPSFPTSLFSVKMAVDKGSKVQFDKQSHLTTPDGTVFPFQVRNDLYHFVVSKMEHAAAVKSLHEWHQALGHANYDSILRLESAVSDMQIGCKDKPSCQTCCLAKQKREVMPKERAHYANEPLTKVHADLCGPISPVSSGGYRYILNLVDEYSSMNFSYMLRSKDAASQGLLQFLADVAPIGHVKEVHTDGGGEFMGEFESILLSRGIKHTTTAPYSPHQNGKVERFWHTIMDAARSMIIEAQVCKSFWSYAVKYACYIRNRSLLRQGKTPYELFTGIRPSLKRVSIFGSPCTYVDENHKGKLDPRAKSGIFMGIDTRSDGYYVYDDISKATRCSRNVKILAPDNQVGSPFRGIEEHEDDIDDSKSSSDTETSDNGGTAGGRPQRNRRPPDRLEYGKAVIFAMICATNAVNGIPQSYDDALASQSADKWTEAMDKEINSLQDNETWDLVPLPTGRSEIGGKWVYTIKYGSSGEIEKFKARYVAKRFMQVPGIDFTEIFSPTAKITTVRLLLQIAVESNLYLHQLDVKTAYLNAPIDTEIFVAQPKGYEKYKGGVKLTCRLNKSLYGLKQSGRNFNNMLVGFLLKNGFRQSAVDQCLFSKDAFGMIYIIFWVDDIIIACQHKGVADDVINLLQTSFKMDDRGQLKWFLGFEIVRAPGYIGICQKQFVKKVLEKFGMADSKPVDTPAIQTSDIAANPDNEAALLDGKFDYQGAIGSLLYLALTSRPDICWAVSRLSRFMKNPANEHIVGVKRVLRYVRGTSDVILGYKKVGASLNIFGFCDADWGSCVEDRHSTTGYLFRCGPGTGPISWASHKQRTVALSTCEAEYMALSDAVKEAAFLKQLFDSFGQTDSESKLFCDNQGTIALARNPVQHQRSKHIDIRYHYIREYFAQEGVTLEHVSTTENLADIMTKATGSIIFKKLCKMIFGSDHGGRVE